MNNFRWYRQLRGGIWIKYFDKRTHIHGGIEFWKRYIFASEASVDIDFYENTCNTNVIAYEVYQKQLSNTAVNLFIRLQKNVWGTEATKIISDGYHTFSELYEHRNKLFINLMNLLSNGEFNVWKSHRHTDNEQCEAGWFIAGYDDKLSYHLPMEYWDKVNVPVVDKSLWDGSSSQEQCERMLDLFKWGYYKAYIEIDSSLLIDEPYQKGDRIIHTSLLHCGTVVKQRGRSVYYHKDGDPKEKVCCTSINKTDRL